MMDEALKAIIDRGIAAGLSDDDIGLLAAEHRRRNPQTPTVTSDLSVAPGAVVYDQPAGPPAPLTASQQSEQDPLGYAAEFARNLFPSSARAVQDTVLGLTELGRQVAMAPRQMTARSFGSDAPVELAETAKGLIPGVVAMAKDYADTDRRREIIRDDPARIIADGAAVISGLGGAARVGARAVAAPLRRSAERQVVKAMAPTTVPMKQRAARGAPAVLDETSLPRTRQQLLDYAQQTADDIGTQVETAYAQYGSRPVDTRAILQQFDDEIAKGTTSAGQPIPGAPVRLLRTLRQTVADLGPQATVDDLRRIRQQWDAKGRPKTLTISQNTDTYKLGGDAVRGALADAVPEVADLNRRYAQWADVRDVLTKTVERTSGHGVTVQSALRGGPAGAALAAAGVGIPGAVPAAGLGALYFGATSPTGRMVRAQTYSHIGRAADAIGSAPGVPPSVAVPAAAQLIPRALTAEEADELRQITGARVPGVVVRRP